MMNINKLLIKDSKGKPSVTMTAFVCGFVVVNLKLIVSGLTIAGYDMAPFTGVDYSAAIGALGAVYVMRRNGENTELDKVNENTDKLISKEKPGVAAPRTRKTLPKTNEPKKTMWKDSNER